MSTFIDCRPQLKDAIRTCKLRRNEGESKWIASP
ncbi:MAG: hypothetical protein GDYSWBUE_001258 [Candidatus Fervidibacterota bacterium]